MTDKVFVIIVTYNGEKWIRKCLNSIFDSSIVPKVILVDNMSSDSTLSIVNNEFSEVVVIESETNLGFGKANNIGLNYALKQGGEFFLLLNQDAYLQKDTVDNLITQLKNNQDYGIVSPIHLAGNEKQIDLQFQSYLVPSTCRIFHNDMFLNQETKSIYEVSFINAAIWLLNRKTLKKVGGFNPYFFHYAEDNDYVNRCKFKGLKLGVIPNCFAIHDREQKFRKASKMDIANYLNVKLMDPNQNKSIKSTVVLAFKLSIKNVLKFKFKTSRQYLKCAFRIIGDSKKIIHLKQQALTKDYPFLEF